MDEDKTDVIGEVDKLEPKPGDVLVIRVDTRKMGDDQVFEMVDSLNRRLNDKLPDSAIIIVDSGADIGFADRHSIATALEVLATSIRNWADEVPFTPQTVSTMIREQASNLRKAP